MEYNVFMFDCVIQSSELNTIVNQTAKLQYFSPSKMWENSELYFQWNEQWLKNLSQK